MITEQRIRNILESLTYKAAAGSTIAVEAIAVITELAKLRAEPPRPAAIVRLYDTAEIEVHAFEVFQDALDFMRRNKPIWAMKTDGPWIWHPARAAEGEAK